jgi:hypothetical protein
MKIYETITASGSGTWDKKYQIAMITRRRSFTTYRGDQERSIFDYVVEFKTERRTSGDGRRNFPSEKERDLFVAKTFTGLNLHTPNQPVAQEKASFLAELAGEKLSSVVFVEDYVQLLFAKKTFNLYRWPDIYIDQKILRHSDNEYPAALQNLTGLAVVSADEYLDIGLTITFKKDTMLAVSLLDNNADSLVEYAHYQSPSHLAIWRQGEHP